MGPQETHPRPSPLQIIAICQARAEGLSSRELQRRTGYSHMSVQRWCNNYGGDAAIMHDWHRRYRIDMRGHTFDDYYPNYVIPKPGEEFKPGYSVKRRVIFKFHTEMGRK